MTSPAPEPPPSAPPQTAPPQTAPPAVTRARNKDKDKGGGAWIAKSDGSGKIYFDFNPEKITISHTASTTESTGKSKDKNANTVSASTVEESVRAQGITTVKIDNIVFDGNVKATCEQLLAWSFAIPPGSGENPDIAVLPELKFSWGNVIILATLNQVSIDYTRFSTRGIPIRAKVSLTLHQKNVPLTPTNPSSGGLPGRRTHVVTVGECLPAIATASYGGPGDWRPLARANGIDDPLRVRPGTVLYLPGPGELVPLPAERS